MDFILISTLVLIGWFIPSGSLCSDTKFYKNVNDSKVFIYLSLMFRQT